MTRHASYAPTSDTTTGVADPAELAMWMGLGMDDVSVEMLSGISPEREALFMGTGYTVNACYICGNSANSWGNAGCC